MVPTNLGQRCRCSGRARSTGSGCVTGVVVVFLVVLVVVVVLLVVVVDKAAGAALQMVLTLPESGVQAPDTRDHDASHENSRFTNDHDTKIEKIIGYKL